MPRAKERKPVALNLWGEPLEEAPQSPGTPIVPLDFETHAVRMIVIKGEPWWVASDVCRAIEIGNITDAMSRLDTDEKSTFDSIEGGRSLHIINEPGLYSLILGSRKPEAKRFKRWITHEVLPTIRRTGSYSLPKRDRVGKEAKRLKCDPETAKARCDQFKLNKHVHRQMLDDGACPNDIKDFHNAAYKGQTGKDAKQLRSMLGLKSYRQPPLDRMGLLALSQNHHAKALARKIIEEGGIPLDEQPEIVEITARDIAAADFATLGGGYAFGVIDDPKRGPILDVIKQLKS